MLQFTQGCHACQRQTLAYWAHLKPMNKRKCCDYGPLTLKHVDKTALFKLNAIWRTGLWPNAKNMFATDLKTSTPELNGQLPVLRGHGLGHILGEVS